MADPNAQNALSNLKQEFATFLRVLGSYPTDVTEAWVPGTWANTNHPLMVGIWLWNRSNFFHRSRWRDSPGSFELHNSVNLPGGFFVLSTRTVVLQIFFIFLWMWEELSTHIYLLPQSSWNISFYNFRSTCWRIVLVGLCVLNSDGDSLKYQALSVMFMFEAAVMRVLFAKLIGGWVS